MKSENVATEFVFTAHSIHLQATKYSKMKSLIKSRCCGKCVFQLCCVKASAVVNV